MAEINRAAEVRAFHYFRSIGMTIAGAIGLIDNLETESDGFYFNRMEYLLKSRLKEDGMIYTDDSYTAAIDSGAIGLEKFLHPREGCQYGFGLAQWTSPGRKETLWKWAKERGVSIADETLQLEYLIWELKNKYQNVWKVLTTATSIRTASDYVLKHFEIPANTGEAVCRGRADRGYLFEKYLKCMEQKGENNMGIIAQQAIDVMKSWIGLSRAKGTHKPIIDLYNSHYPLARGYKVSYTDDYCDTTVSAVFIKLNAVDLIGGTECGVEEHINKFKAAGIWQEDGTITPKPGYIICYNWDTSIQPNDGYADHIGIVESVDTKARTMVVIEGNTNGGVVGRRTIPIGWGYIRGYAVPKYASSQTTDTKTENKSNTETGGTGYMFEVKMVQSGSTGNDVKLLQRLLKSNGCEGKDGKNLTIDGSCGANTVYAIKEYQKKKKLEVDGCAGNATWKSILLR